MVAIPLVLAFLCAPLGTLSGTVVDSVSGAPLNQVELRATPANGSFRTTTDAKGSFTMVDLPAGEYRLQAARNGYLDNVETLISLAAGEVVGGLQIKMLPYGVIAGTVRADGKPLAAATIVLLQQVYEYGRPAIVLKGIYDDRTDDLGQYRIAGVEPGKYYVRAIARTAREDGEEQQLVPTLYPGVIDASAARLVEIAPGEHALGIDIPLVRSPMYRVTVQTAGAPVDYLYLSSNPELDMLALHFHAAKNKDGDFEFPGVAAGLYTLSVSGGRLTALSVSRDMVTRLPALTHAHVTVHINAEGKPGIKVPLTLISASNRFDPVQGEDHIFAPDADHYQLYVKSPPSDLVIKSMRSGSTDVYQNGLTVGDSDDDIHIEVVLAPEGGTIDGGVLDADGKPAAGATVLLVAEPKLRGRYDSFHAFTADQHGRFHFDNIRPGEYKLFAWDDVEVNGWFDSEFLKKFEDQGKPVTLPASGHATSQLHLH